MYNQKLVKVIRGGIAAVLAFLFLALGYSAALVQQRLSQAKTDKVVTTTKAPISQNEVQKGLTEKEVNDFLIAYYTRKDLGENRTRYKPFMTEALYQSATMEEDKPVNQAYKGYVVDQVFTEATIYIDKANQAAIVQVAYENTLLQEKDNRQSASTKQRGNVSLRLKYQEQEGRYLLAHMEPVVLTDSSEAILTPYTNEVVATESSSSEPEPSTPASSSTEPTTPTSDSSEGETNDGQN